jgi:hypothetical protein
MTNVLNLTAMNFTMFLKIANFAVKVEKVEEIFESIEKANEEFGESKELKNMKFIDRICKLVWLQAFLGCLFSIMVPITTSELANQLWYPFEFEKGGVVFWAIAVFQTVNICVVSGVDVVLEFIPTILSGAILDLLKQLTAKLKNLTDAPPSPLKTVATSSKNTKLAI